MDYLIAAYALGVGAPLLYGLHLARQRRAVHRALRPPGTSRNPG